MAILLPNSLPAGTMQVIRSALTLVFQSAGSKSALRQIDPSKASVAAHLPLYQLDVDALAKGAGLPATTRAGSRFMIMVGPDVKAAIDVSTDKDGLSAKDFLSIMDGAIVEGTKKAIDLAAADPDNTGCHVMAWDCAPLRVSVVAVLTTNESVRALYVITPASSGGDPARVADLAALSGMLKPMAVLAQQSATVTDSDVMGG